MIETSLGLSPALPSTKLATMLVDEPGAVTPIFLPFRSATDLKFGIVFGLMPSTICGARPCSTKARRRWPLTCMLIVCSNAPETTSALPPTTALQRARAAGEIGDRDVEPFVLEVAERSRRSSAAGSRAGSCRRRRASAWASRAPARATSAGRRDAAPGRPSRRRAGGGGASDRSPESSCARRAADHCSSGIRGRGAQAPRPVESLAMGIRGWRWRILAAQALLASSPLLAQPNAPTGAQPSAPGDSRRAGRARRLLPPGRRAHPSRSRRARSTSRRGSQLVQIRTVLKGRGEPDLGRLGLLRQRARATSSPTSTSSARRRSSPSSTTSSTSPPTAARRRSQILQIDVLHDLALLQAPRDAASGAPRALRRARLPARERAARAGRAHLLARQSARRRLRGHAGHLQRRSSSAASIRRSSSAARSAPA